MKKVREYLYEKFSEEGDPVHDMGIGGFNAGRTRSRLKKEYRENFIKTFKDALLNKHITGEFNQMLVVKNDSIKTGKGWGKYTIYVGKINEFDEDSHGLSVFDTEEKASYTIPYDDKKIFIEE
jgi:ribosomal protein L21E